MTRKGFHFGWMLITECLIASCASQQRWSNDKKKDDKGSEDGRAQADASMSKISKEDGVRDLSQRAWLRDGDWAGRDRIYVTGTTN